MDKPLESPEGACPPPQEENPDSYYHQHRPELLQYIPKSARRVLDVGCGAATFTKAVKQLGIDEVVGIEMNEAAAREASEVLDRVIVGNIEEMDLPFEDGYFDCVIFADILEHLYDPEAVLRKVARVLSPTGLMIMSIPNVRYYLIWAMLSAGRWKYDDSGVLDRTHIRFFTAYEMRALVRDAGLRVQLMRPLTISAPDILPRNEDGTVPIDNIVFTPRNDKDYLDLLTIQYIILATHKQART